MTSYKPREDSGKGNETTMRIALLILSFAWCLGACQTAHPELPHLATLTFHGNSSLSDRQILRRMALEPSSKIPFFGDKRYYDAALLRADLNRIERIYESYGIYGTQVVRSEVTEDEGNARRVHLSIWIVEGKQIQVSRVKLSDYPLPTAPEFELEEGVDFTEDLYEQDKALLINRLKDSGYPFADARGRVVVDLLTQSAEVLFEAVPQQKYNFGPIHIVGNDKISATQILEESDLTQGQLFSQADILFAEKALYALNVFRLVEIKTGAPENDVVPITIRVDEGSFQTIGIGGGMGVATSRNEIRARLQYRHNNFLGGLRRFEAEARPAYIYVPNIIDQESRGLGGQARMSVFQPDLFLSRGIRHLGLTISTNYQRDILDGFIVNSGGGRIGLIWPTNSPSTIEFGYNALFFNLIDYPSEVQQCGTQTCLVSYFDQRAIFDRRDDRVNPKKGYWLSLMLNEAGVAGSFRYLSVIPEARVYFPGPWDTTHAARLEMGILITRDESDSPIPKRFYSGGPGSHRGFAMRRLSPLVVSKQRARSIPIGGNSMIASSVEWRIPLVTQLEGVVFTDAGNVETESLSYPLSRLNYAAGLGLKYDSPVAPIRLDVGYRLNKPERFQTEPLFAFHLTIGDAF